MASYTGNLNLKKPALDDDALITDINNNMDILDAAVNGIQDGLAIVANGNTHVAITSGQFVYVRNHSTLTEGLYVASTNIAANATLSSSNLTADAAGGLNALNSNVNKLKVAAGFSVTSLNDIQYHLLGLTANMENQEGIPVVIYINGNFSYFRAGSNYSGVLHLAYKATNNTLFSCVLSSIAGDEVVVGYNNGTWTFNGITDKITNYVELGEISDLNISPREANKTYHFTAKHTASGIPNANFDCIAGYLFTEKDASWFGTEIVFTVVGIFYRKLDSGTFGPWYTLNMTAV